MAWLPEAWHSHGLLIYGKSIRRDTFVSKGFYVSLPDHMKSSVGQLMAYHSMMQGLLGTLSEDLALQVQWSVDSDYAKEIEAYRDRTAKYPCSRWALHTREAKERSVSRLMADNKLRRERLAMFIGRKLTTLPKRGFMSEAEMDKFLSQQSKNLDDKIANIEMMIAPAVVKIMSDREMHAYAHTFFNPSIGRANIPMEDRYAGFDPDFSVLESCMNSDAPMASLDRECAAFVMDDHYHSILTFRRWPQHTDPLSVTRLTQSVGMDFWITQNIFPLEIRKEIQKEEKLARRLQGDAARERSVSKMNEVGLKDEKVRSLASGQISPFNVLTIIRVWDRTVDGLFSKVSAIKTSLSNLPGVQYHQCNHFTQARNLFYESFPGWIGGSVREWDLYTESPTLANMMPTTTSFLGDLDEGEAMYYGNNGGIVGVKTFAGNTPQHAIVLGMRGAGKSALMVDLLSQTEPGYDYTAIIEEGLSYGVYTQAMGKEPIIIQPDGDLTLNYFDTVGLPLSTLNLSNAAALCLTMVGASESEDVNNLRIAMLGEYINQLYSDVYEEWRMRNEDKLSDLARTAYSIVKYRERRMPRNASFIEGFTEFMAWARTQPDEAEVFYQSFPEEDVLAFEKDSQTAQTVRDLAFYMFTPEEFPRHQNLVEMLRYGKLSHHLAHQNQEIDFMATMLSAWCREGGKNGKLVDGISNFTLGDTIDHFELGFIPDSSMALKKVAGFLITNFVRQSIVGRPRSQKKRVIFEEISRFMSVPGGDKIVAESYAQFRKFNCWAVVVSQQVNQLLQTPLWPVIKGNSTEFFLLRQNNRAELESLAREIDLPDIHLESILQYPLPEHIKGQKYSSCTYMTFGEQGVSCGTLRHFASKEMLYMAGSDGEHFDRRSRALAQHEDVVDGILAECAV